MKRAHFTFKELWYVLILEAFRSGTGNNSWVSGSRECKKYLYVTYIHIYINTHTHTWSKNCDMSISGALLTGN